MLLQKYKDNSFLLCRLRFCELRSITFGFDSCLHVYREPERGGRATSQRNTVQLSSASLLEITLTSSLPAAVALAEEVVRSILNIQQHPWQLQQQIMLSRDQRALRSLQNISGAALEFKDAAQASDASAGAALMYKQCIPGACSAVTLHSVLTINPEPPASSSCHRLACLHDQC